MLAFNRFAIAVPLLFISMVFGRVDPFEAGEDRTRRVAAWYESLVQQSLARYYDGSSFLVDARILFHDMVVPLNPPAAESPPATQSSRIRSLPGLPILPEEMRGEAPPDPQQHLKLREDLGVRYVDLTVLVDTVYTMEDLDFVMELASMAAKLDTYRGDRINIRKKLFPRTRREINGHRIAALPDTLQRRESRYGREFHPWSAYWWELPSLLPLLLLLLFLSFMVWLVVRSLRQSQLRVQASAPVVVPSAPSTAPLPSPDEEDTAAAAQVLQEMRESSLNALIGDPAGSAAVLANWIEVHREKGLSEATVAIEALDRRVLDVLRPHLGVEDIRALQVQLETRAEAPVQERIEVLRFLLRDLRNLRRHRGGEEALADLFGFLRQLSILQLQHILKGEPPGIAGLALAQLQPERAAALLRLMDREGRSRILVAMGQIDPIPVQTYKELAERLSRKALEVANMRFVAADGVQTVLDLLQNLGIQEQTEYLGLLGEMDMALAQRIRRYYVPFEELPSIPEKILNRVLVEFDRDLLASALVGTEAGWREALLSVIPARMRLMIESTMETRLEQGPAEAERARRALLTSLRKELQGMGGLP